MTSPETQQAWSPDEVRACIAEIAETPGPILRCLQAVQGLLGYVPVEAIAVIADACNVSRADVHGVLTFYADLRTEAPPAVPVRLCAAEACQAAGGRALAHGWAQECRDDSFLAGLTGVNDPVYCLGNCALAPAAMVGTRLVGLADVHKIQIAVERQRDAALNGMQVTS